MKGNKENGGNVMSASAYNSLLYRYITFFFCVQAVMFVLLYTLDSLIKDPTSVVLEKPPPITTEKVLREELTFKVAGPVKPVEGASALPLGSVLVEGKNPNPDERDVVVNAQVIPFREIPVGTEVTIHRICDTGISPQSFFYYLVVVEEQ